VTGLPKQPRGFSALVLLAVTLTAAGNPADAATVAETPTSARTPVGDYISWVEHLVDTEDINGGVAVRGADGLKIADLDRDGYMDIVSVHEDSNHLRIAYGSELPDAWDLYTLAEGPIAGAAEDVAVGDINADGWPDLLFACEEAHIVYFQNPGTGARQRPWSHIIPAPAVGRGSWLRVFIADVTAEGSLDVLAANKGGTDLVDTAAGEPNSGTTTLLTIKGNALEAENWQEQVLMEHGVPNIALPVDIDGDGDIDVLGASRLENRSFIIENVGTTDAGKVETRIHAIVLSPGFAASENWRGGTGAFHAAFHDIDGDDGADLVAVVAESDADGLNFTLGWMQQPETLDKPWTYHRIGHFLPDWITGFALADIDSDGDLDVVAGGYSGLNVLDLGYSGASRDFDDPRVTPSSSTGRIAWFENPGRVIDSTAWHRHDISRRVRGMYDEFIPRDMDDDGDIDFVATRGNSGSFDGVFWLEQRRTEQPVPVFTSARAKESRHLPLPPHNWRAHYDRTKETIAPNKKNTRPKGSDAHQNNDQ
jgi:hypothetical protein